MAQITKMLGVAIADSDAGRISRAQLLSIFQEAIDNGDVLSNENRQYVVTVVMPLVDAGILKRSDHLDQFAEQMNRAIRERVALLRAGKQQETSDTDTGGCVCGESQPNPGAQDEPGSLEEDHNTEGAFEAVAQGPGQRQTTGHSSNSFAALGVHPAAERLLHRASSPVVRRFGFMILVVAVLSLSFPFYTREIGSGHTVIYQDHLGPRFFLAQDPPWPSNGRVPSDSDRFRQSLRLDWSRMIHGFLWLSAIATMTLCTVNGIKRRRDG